LKEDTSTKYADWIKKLINEYNFTENVDYISFSKKNEKGGRPSIEFIVTVGMSKEICMLDKSNKNKD
jgi:phage anti-repressor protein